MSGGPVPPAGSAPPPGGVTIRAIRPADAPAVVTILEAGLRDQAAHAADSAAAFEQEWAACRAALDADPGGWWLAERAGEAVALLWLEFQPDPLFPACVVQQLAVTPALRGQGIGTALLGFAEEQARAAGAAVLIIGTLPGNPALRLYRRRGFERVPAGYGESRSGQVLLWKRFMP